MASQDRRPHVVLRALPLLAIIALMLAFVPVALGAPTPSSGFGVDISKDYVPATVPNDYTAAGVQYYSYQTLAPDTTYYIKAAFCQGAYDAATARGLIWNAATSAWVRTSDAWSDCPQFTTDAAGSVSSTWTYVAFGDDTQSGAWTLYFVARPVSGSDAEAVVGTKTATISVLDMTTVGAWVHNGVSVYTGKVTRVEADATSANGGSQGNTLALFQSEDNGCDDSDSSIIPEAAFSGGFRLWMPIPNPGYDSTNENGDIYLNVNRKTLTSFNAEVATRFAEPPADTDMAVMTNGEDMTPPGKPATLTATAATDHIDLAWPAAADNVGVTAYRVSRWTAAPAGATYSPEHKLIATVTPAADGSGSYVDNSALVNGTVYYYEVRAVDAASSIGPRSATAQALFDNQAPVTTVSGVRAGWVRRPVRLTFSAVAAQDEAPIAYTEFRVAGGAWTKGDAVTVSRQGVTTVEYRSADTAGNVETPKSCTLRIDARAPKVTAYGPVTAWRGGYVRFTFRVSDIHGPVSVKIGVTRYGKRVATYNLGMKPIGHKAAGMVACELPVARYSWRLVVTDAAGNRTRTRSETLRILPATHGRK